MNNQNELIEILNKQLEALRKIRDESGYVGYQSLLVNQKHYQVKQKLDRWEIRTSQIIKKHIDVEEEERFANCVNNMDLSIQIQQYDSYLQELINEIKQSPEFFDEFQSDKSTLSQLEIKKIWGEDYVNKKLVFLSHKAEYKKEMSDIKNNLKKENINCFIAHQDIQPSLEWQKEIIKALDTMHIFIGIVTSNFHTGSWTDQEIGYSYKRGVPRLFIKVGKSDPQGFISSEQALNANWNNIHIKIIKHLQEYI